MSLAVVPPHLQTPQQAAARNQYEHQLMKAGADVILSTPKKHLVGGPAGLRREKGPYRSISAWPSAPRPSAPHGHMPLPGNPARQRHLRCGCRCPSTVINGRLAIGNRQAVTHVKAWLDGQNHAWYEFWDGPQGDTRQHRAHQGRANGRCGA